MSDRPDGAPSRSNDTSIGHVIRTAYRHSALRSMGGWLERVAAKFSASLVAIGRTPAANTVRAWITASILYRWLSRDPQPIALPTGGVVVVRHLRRAADFWRARLRALTTNSSADRYVAPTLDRIQRSPVETIAVVVATAALTNLLVTVITQQVTAGHVALRVVPLGLALFVILTSPSRSWLEHSRLWGRFTDALDRLRRN